MRLSGRAALTGMGLARVGIGTALLARPALLPRFVGVDTGTARRVGWLGAMVGARDVALGAGLVVAVRRRADARPWLAAQAFSDAADLVVMSFAVARGWAAPVPGVAAAGMAAAGVVAETAAIRELSEAPG